jgi:hypothetical protein
VKIRYISSFVKVKTYLLTKAETAEEKAHAENEQQVREDGAKQRRLHNGNLICNQCDDTDQSAGSRELGDR